MKYIKLKYKTIIIKKYILKPTSTEIKKNLIKTTTTSTFS